MNTPCLGEREGEGGEGEDTVWRVWRGKRKGWEEDGEIKEERGALLRDKEGGVMNTREVEGERILDYSLVS